MSVSLSALRRCFEGAVPGMIGTCDAQGMPNVAYLSQVHYVDDEHVALSFQFFNTTRRNILANPTATIQVVDPLTAQHYQLHISYLHTVSEGPLFESMKARLAGIASHSGMTAVFHLKGSDVYRVRHIEVMPGPTTPFAVPPAPNRLPAVRRIVEHLSACNDLAALLNGTLTGISEQLGMQHAMLLMLDPCNDKLYTVASCGYPVSGVGSEIGIGEGIIGVAAREKVPIRINHCATEYLYSQAVRESYLRENSVLDIELSIPLPGLARSGSQIAVPIAHGQRLVGVLYVESPQEMRFSWDDEDALVMLASFLALAIAWCEHGSEAHADAVSDKSTPTPVSGKLIDICFYRANQSIFINHDYLIKGVAGAILWKLVSDYVEQGRDEFTNRELRLDPALRLPDIVTNLEARLILLQRRLAERSQVLAIVKTGRGRFRLQVKGELHLREATD